VSAEAIVAEPLRLAGWKQEAALDEARKALETFGVKKDLWAAYPTTFSGGEQQKVNLARALILPQKLLMLDEPTASLDANARAALVARLQELKGQGTAMIGVFHHPDDVLHLIDRIVDLTPEYTQSEERSDVAL
jgi:alpha-D-ribose 1-methylphosphonate 5-triphosphate synthase subunit PhnL